MGSPINRVPSELWSEIFGYTVESNSSVMDSRVPPISTSQVCVRWRGICHSTKFLWRNINLSEYFLWSSDGWAPIREDHFLTRVDFLLTKRLEYARGAPLRIQISGLRKPIEELVMKKLLLHSYSWQSVDLQMMAAFQTEDGTSWLHHVHRQANVVDATPRLAGVKFPILADVRLKAHRATSGVYDTISMIKAASRLRTVSLDMMHWEKDTLGGIKYRGKDLLGWSKLTDLKLSWIFDGALPPTFVPLTGLVNLSLQLFAESTTTQLVGLSSTVMPYTLSSLKSLWMEGINMNEYDETLIGVPPDVILSQLKLPRLESLSVKTIVFPSTSLCALIKRSGCAIRSLSVEWCHGLDVTVLGYMPSLRSLSATSIFYPIVMRLVCALSVNDPARTPKCPLLERLVLSDEPPLLDDYDAYSDIIDEMESEDHADNYRGIVSYRPHVMEILNLLEQRRSAQGPGSIPVEACNRSILDTVKLSTDFSLSKEVVDRDEDLNRRFRSLREGGLELHVSGSPHNDESRVAAGK